MHARISVSLLNRSEVPGTHPVKCSRWVSGLFLVQIPRARLLRDLTYGPSSSCSILQEMNSVTRAASSRVNINVSKRCVAEVSHVSSDACFTCFTVQPIIMVPYLIVHALPSPSASGCFAPYKQPASGPASWPSPAQRPPGSATFCAKFCFLVRKPRNAFFFFFPSSNKDSLSGEQPLEASREYIRHPKPVQLLSLRLNFPNDYGLH